MKLIVPLVVVFLGLMVAYLFSTGEIELPSMPEPAPAPVAAVITWEQEFADLCRSARRVRDEIRSNELGQLLAESRCAALVGADGWTAFPAAPVAAPIPPASVPVQPPLAPAPQAERVVPRVNAEPHMTDTCYRMREKLNDQTLNDSQWYSLRDSYNGLCQ